MQVMVVRVFKDCECGGDGDDSAGGEGLILEVV